MKSSMLISWLSVTDLGDLVQRCVECGGEWNITTMSGGDELRNASCFFPSAVAQLWNDIQKWTEPN